MFVFKYIKTAVEILLVPGKMIAVAFGVENELLTTIIGFVTMGICVIEFSIVPFVIGALVLSALVYTIGALDSLFTEVTSNV